MSLTTALAGKVKQSVASVCPSVCPSVCVHSIFWTNWPLHLRFCLCVCHNHSLPGIEGQGDRWRWKVNVNAVTLTSNLDRSSLSSLLKYVSMFYYKICVSTTIYTAIASSVCCSGVCVYPVPHCVLSREVITHWRICDKSRSRTLNKPKCGVCTPANQLTTATLEATKQKLYEQFSLLPSPAVQQVTQV